MTLCLGTLKEKGKLNFLLKMPSFAKYLVNLYAFCYAEADKNATR